MGVSQGRHRGSDHVFRLSVPPDARYVANVRQGLIAFGERHRVASNEMEKLLLAVGEAMANAVEHADATHDIEVQCHVDDHEIVATVIDSGRGVEQPVADDTIMPMADPLAEGGRGIPIMQRCTDMFTIRPLPGGGTGVVLGLLRQFRSSTHRC